MNDTWIRRVRRRSDYLSNGASHAIRLTTYMYRLNPAPWLCTYIVDLGCGPRLHQSASGSARASTPFLVWRQSHRSEVGTAISIPSAIIAICAQTAGSPREWGKIFAKPVTNVTGSLGPVNYYPVFETNLSGSPPVMLAGTIQCFAQPRGGLSRIRSMTTTGTGKPARRVPFVVESDRAFPAV
jgi:hypothetical protein